MASQLDISALADTVTHLGGLALAFGRVDRTTCYHADWTKESDTDHTVMLSWIPPALAARLYPDRLDTGLVSQFASVHDMPEVHAGDTPTLRISAAGERAKDAREHEAAVQLAAETAALPWVAAMLRRYDAQQEPEARFVRAVDKLLPKVVHQHDGCAGLVEHGVTSIELRALIIRQAESIRGYAGEFTELIDLYTEIGSRAADRLAHKEAQAGQQMEAAA